MPVAAPCLLSAIKSAEGFYLGLSPELTHGIAGRSTPPLTGRPVCTLPYPRHWRRGGHRGMRVVLKGIHTVRMKLASGETRTYYYAWRGGPKLAGTPGSPEFMRSYNDAIAARKRPAQGVLFALIAEFKTTGEYTKKSAATKRAYNHYLKMIEAEFGDMPIAALSDPECRGEFKAWRDKLSDKPRTADYAWTTLARVLSVAKDRGRIPVNPCERGGRLWHGSRADKVWTDHDEEAFLASAPAHLHLALLLGLWTGQRQGDLLRMAWTQYDGKVIRLRQSKTGARVVIPVGAPLKAALDAIEKKDGPILRTTDGTAWTSDGFRSSWGKACEDAQIVGLTFGDLRGTAVTRLAVAGCTEAEIATITGHSLRSVRAVLDRHYLHRDPALATAAIQKLERNAPATKTVKGV
jgi:integrase